MASIVSADGIQVEVVGDELYTDECLSRLRDLIIVRLRERRRLTFVAIGKVVGLDPDAARKRYDRVPADAKRIYGTLELE